MIDAVPDVQGSAAHDAGARTARIAALVSELHAITDELEALHPGRKFPLDGHLVGSLGEAAAAALFYLDLVPASTAGHDAVSLDGKRVEIKATYGISGVGIRQTSQAACDALIVLKLSSDPQVQHEVVFNGPLSIALTAAGKPQSNGQARIGLSRLRALDRTVVAADRVPRRV